ncbi:MAG: hypothetical protein ACD_2C00073G0040 [uncultured bacterium (gcode 4)]|uniref:Response regulatory domain-containing protein n=1 Tax=uncultured bacterium (gcode 4) TaxID=1234023 RepID=K2G6J4_9BACT|nr:MAG: hypothetical protein ACD_2C00073G0040 [uncultured bacterium (gcode 4)]
MEMNKTVLIVDDHLIMRKRLEMDLKAKWFNVLEAKNWIEAVEIVTRRAVDLILMDINFDWSDENGIGITKKIRQILALNPERVTKIICISTDVDNWSNEIFDWFCSKPLKTTDFNTIRSTLNNQ